MDLDDGAGQSALRIPSGTAGNQPVGQGPGQTLHRGVESRKCRKFIESLVPDGGNNPIQDGFHGRKIEEVPVAVQFRAPQDPLDPIVVVVKLILGSPISSRKKMTGPKG